MAGNFERKRDLRFCYCEDFAEMDLLCDGLVLRKYIGTYVVQVFLCDCCSGKPGELGEFKTLLEMKLLIENSGKINRQRKNLYRFEEFYRGF